MSSNDSIVELLVLLYDGTKAATAPWKRTEDPDTFQATFPEYSVRIQQTSDEQQTDITLSILNAKGDVVEQIPDGELKNWQFPGQSTAFNYMADLWSMARRSALGADKAVSSIIDILKRSNPGTPIPPVKPTKKRDDDLPF
jgi:hypothetical protein